MRSFIAIKLPETVQSSLAELQLELKSTGAHIRWVKPENIHLTLKFLGDTEEKAVDRIISALQGTCNTFEPFRLELRGVGLFPGVRSPRIIWAGVSCGSALTSIQSDIEKELSLLGFEKENRKFMPHLTLGRFKSSRGQKTIQKKVDHLRDSSCGFVDVTSVSLIKSELSPAGSRYTRIAEIPLHGPGV